MCVQIVRNKDDDDDCILCVYICHYIKLYLWHVLNDDEHQIR